MRFLLILTAALAVSACSLIYKLPTRQGNVIDQKQVDQLQVGMTREQVQFLMGTAVASSPLTDNEWDYVGYYKSPHGVESQRTVSVFFNGNTVSRIEGQKVPDAEEISTQGTDPASVIKRRKKEAHEDARAASERAQDSGVSQPAPGEIPKAP